MNARPYPNRKRALHQLDRHAYEYRPHAAPTDHLRTAIYRAYRIPPRLLGIHPANEPTA
jgi:hypothetical protein